MFIRRILLLPLVLSCVFGLIAQPVLAAPTTPRKVITAANASKLQPLFKLGNGIVRHLDWSPDGKQLFVSTRSGVYIYNPSDLKQEPRLLDPDGSNQVVFNLAGTRLATFAEHRRVSIWDAKTLNKIDQIAIPTQDDEESPDPIIGVWFDQADSPIIAYDHEHNLTVWNSQTQDYLIQNQGFSGIDEIHLSSDKRIMLTSDGYSAELWDLKTGEPLQSLEREKDPSGRSNINAAAFNPTDTLIATANGNAPTDASNYLVGNDIILWDTQTRKQLRALKGHDFWVTQVVFHPKGELIASGSGDSTVRLWNVKTGKQIARFQADDTVNALAFNPSGTLLAAASEGGELNLWNINSGKLLGQINGFGGYTGPAYTFGVDNSNGECCIVFTRDSKQIAHGQHNGQIQVWDTSVGKRIAVLRGHSQSINGLTYANKEAVLVSAAYDSTLRYSNVTSGQLIYKQQISTFPDYVLQYALKSSPDGKYFTAKTTQKQGVVLLYSATSHQKIWDSSKFILDNDDEPYQLPNAFSPDSRFLAFVSNTVNYQLHLYEIGTKKDPIQLPLSCSPSSDCTNVPENLTFSADGKQLYVAFRDGAIDIVDVERRQVASRLPYVPLDYNGETPTVTHFNKTIAVSYSRYDRTNKGVIYVRDLQNGQLLQRYETKDVGSSDLNPQGTLVAWWNYKLQVWSVETGKVVFERPRLLDWDDYNYYERDIAFSPDGTLLAIADDEDVITVYGIPSN